MQVRANAKVVSADGKDVGHVRRVVIDPRNDQIRDIVVRKGMLFTEDRVVPIDLVTDTSDEQVRLKVNAKAAEALPFFEESFYVPADGEGTELPADKPAPTPPPFAPAYYWYPPMVGYEPTSIPGTIPPELMGYVLRTERHIPANTVALKEGATVKTRDGHHAGKVEQVLTAAGSDRATHVVVTDGTFNKTRRMIPVDWVAKIAEDEVTLGVTEEVMDKLPVQEH